MNTPGEGSLRRGGGEEGRRVNKDGTTSIVGDVTKMRRRV
jgi:hypothetical protein